MHGVEIGPSKEGIIAGGVPNSILRLCKGLNDYGNKPIIVTNDRAFREARQETHDFRIPYADMRLFLIKDDYPSINYFLNYSLKTAKCINHIAKETNIDLLNGHSGKLELSIVTGISSKYCNIPSVHTVYCPIRPAKSNLMAFTYKYIIFNIKKIIAISDNIKVSLISVGIPSSKIVVIPPLLDFSQLKPNIGGKELRQSLDLNDDDFLIMYLGNLTATKSVDTILDALNLINSRGYNFRFVSGIELTHTGTEQRISELIKKIERYHLKDRIIEIGLNSSVRIFMDASDLLVAPFQNTFEVADYPLTVLEAMAIGTPVITSPVGGITEIIRDREEGVFIDSNDAFGLAQKMMDLMDNRIICRNLSKKALKKIKSKFNKNKILTMTENVYEEVIK